MTASHAAIATAGKWALLIIAYMLLDWATFTPVLAPLGITPWNPAIGLSVAAVIVGGMTYAPLLALAPFLSDIIVRDLPFPWWVTAAEALLTGFGYWGGLALLLKAETGFDHALQSLRDLLLLASLAAASAAFVACGYSCVLWLISYLPGEQVADSILRYWVGDVIGLSIVTPFLLLMASRRDFPELSLEIVLQTLAIFVAVAVVVGQAGAQMMQLSYLLLLPIVWVAVRHGFEGAAGALLLLQVCVMIALQIRGADQSQTTMLQSVMVMLAMSGLAIGRLISERAQRDRRLRLQQDAMARAARLGSMGEFAAALAHELNQPLTAASNYARATLGALQGDAPRIQDARQAATQLIAQVDRSAQVMRRLRELIRVGRLETAPVSLTRMLHESIDLMRPELAKMPAEIDLAIAPDVPAVEIDLLQVEQVVTNLVRNAIEAMAEAKTSTPRVTIAARRVADGWVELAISDNGPGFQDTHASGRNMPFESTKPDGLGVGLSLCRTIIEGHGGVLSLDTRNGGATVRFTLPAARTHKHG